MNRRIIILISFFLLATAILLDLDVLAIYSSIGRLALFDLMVLIAIVLFSLKMVYYRNFIEFNFFIIVILIFSFYIITSGFYLSIVDSRIEFKSVVSVGGKYISYSFLVFQLTNLIINNNLKDNYLQLIMRLNYVVVIIGLAQILAVSGLPFFSDLFLWDNIRGGGHRIAATFRWQGILAFYLGLTLPILIAVALDKNNKKVKLDYLIILLMIVIGFYSGSRSFLLVLIPSLSLFLIKPFILNDFRFSVTKLFFVLITFSGLIYVFLNFIIESRAVRRILGLEGAVGVTTVGPNPRERIAAAGIREWLEYPITGVGSGNLPSLIGQTAHNSYLEVLFENGLIGVFFLLAISLVLFYMSIYLVLKAFKLRSMLPFSLAIVIFNISVYQLTASAIQYRLLWIVLPLLFSQFFYFKYSLRNDVGKD